MYISTWDNSDDIVVNSERNIYMHYLITLGKDYARVNHLLPISDGFDDNYDRTLNPTTISSFTSAAYRSLHSQIQGFVE